MPDAAALRAHLVGVRRGLGVSQADLAGRLGVTQTCMSYRESGKREVSLDDFVAWAAALGVEIGPVTGAESARQGPAAAPTPFRGALGDVTLLYTGDGTLVGGIVDGAFRGPPSADRAAGGPSIERQP